MPFRRTLVVALLSALPMLSAAAADATAPAPEKIKWVLPWKDGVSLTYAEDHATTDETKPQRERSRSTSNTVIRITESSADGFVQTWTGSGYKYEVLEGDKVEEARMKAFASALEDLPVEAQLDAAGNFTKLRNIDVIAPRVRTASRPLVEGMIEDALAQIPDEKVRAQKRAEAASMVDRAMDTMVSPAMMESILSRDLSWYNGFVGIDLEPDMEYGVDVDLPNAAGGPAIPAKLTFSLSVSEDSPDDIFVVYEQAMDSEKAQAALRANAVRLTGEEAQKALANVEISVKDEGLFVVHRPTGVVEMFESTRTTTVSGKEKVERTRLRLLNGDHDHVWKDEEAAAPQAPAKDA